MDAATNDAHSPGLHNVTGYIALGRPGDTNPRRLDARMRHHESVAWAGEYHVTGESCAQRRDDLGRR